MLPKDKAVMMYHKGKMLSENSRDQDSLTAYKQGVAQIDDGVSDPSQVANKILVAKLWAVIGDQYSTLNQNGQAISAYQRALLLDPANYSQLTQVIADLKTTSTPVTAAPTTNLRSFTPTKTPISTVTPLDDIRTLTATAIPTSSGEARG